MRPEETLAGTKWKMANTSERLGNGWDGNFLWERIDEHEFRINLINEKL